MTVVPSTRDLTKRAAGYVDAILKGARPGEMPIQPASQFDWIVNVTTAQAQGLDIPRAVLSQAAELIQ